MPQWQLLRAMGTERDDVAPAVGAVPDGDACHVARPGRRNGQGAPLAAMLQHFRSVAHSASARRRLNCTLSISLAEIEVNPDGNLVLGLLSTLTLT